MLVKSKQLLNSVVTFAFNFHQVTEALGYAYAEQHKDKLPPSVRTKLPLVTLTDNCAGTLKVTVKLLKLFTFPKKCKAMQLN